MMKLPNFTTMATVFNTLFKFIRLLSAFYFFILMFVSNAGEQRAMQGCNSDGNATAQTGVLGRRGSIVYY